ncbi:MAG: nitrogen regulatory protein 1 [Actinomycetota bacterium]|nr:nitrogen regulatory protein 1 [Actinomycetota bacterium]
MVRAIVRPECADDVADALAAAGFAGITRSHVVGRGKQQGIASGSVRYDELPKAMIMMVVCDEDAETVAGIVADVARTGHFGDGKILAMNRTGVIGDGRIFICPLDDAVRVRTGETGDEALT